MIYSNIFAIIFVGYQTKKEMVAIEEKSKKSIFRHLGKTFSGYKKYAVLTMVFGCAEVMLEVLIPMLMSVIVDGGLYREADFMLKWAFSPELVANRNKFVLTVGLIMVCVAIVSMMCGLLAAKFSALSSQGFAKNLRSSLLEKIQSFSFANTDRFSTSSLITRATTDVNTMRMTMQQVLRTLMRSPIMIVMATVMAFTIAPHLAVIFLFCIPLLAAILAVLIKTGQPRFKRMLRKMDAMNKAVQENLVSSRVVKAYVRGDYESKRFEFLLR